MMINWDFLKRMVSAGLTQLPVFIYTPDDPGKRGDGNSTASDHKLGCIVVPSPASCQEDGGGVEYTGRSVENSSSFDITQYPVEDLDEKSLEADFHKRVFDEAQALTVMGRSQVTFGVQIAEGSQGTIFEGTLRVTPQGTNRSSSSSSSFDVNPDVTGHLCVAVKKFRVGGIAHGQVPSQALWASTDCVHVCKPLGVFFAKNAECMVVPRYSRDLRSEIDERLTSKSGRSTNSSCSGPFTELAAVHIMMQLALGLKGLHDCGVYHRDVKASNTLVNPYRNELSEFYEVVLADYESAADTRGAGSSYWRAPEVLVRSKEEGVRAALVGPEWQAADVYSFGMTCYEILTGELPRVSGYAGILSGERPALPDHVPERLRDMIRGCWRHEPDSRLSLDAVLRCLEAVDNHRLAKAGLGIPRSFMKLRPDQANVGAPFPIISLRPTLSHILTSIPQRNAHQRLDEHPERRSHFAFWASEYVSTQEQFVSQFDRAVHLRTIAAAHTVCHDSLTFAEFVERRRLLAFIRLQRDGSGHNVEATKDEYSRSGPIRVEARLCGSKLLSPSEGLRRHSSAPAAGLC